MAWKSWSSSPVVNSRHGGKRIVPQSSLRGLKLPKEWEIPGNKKQRKTVRNWRLKRYHEGEINFLLILLTNIHLVCIGCTLSKFREGLFICQSVWIVPPRDLRFTTLYLSSSCYADLKMIIMRILGGLWKWLEQRKDLKKLFPCVQCEGYQSSRWVPGNVYNPGEAGESRVVQIQMPLGLKPLDGIKVGKGKDDSGITLLRWWWLL